MKHFPLQFLTLFRPLFDRLNINFEQMGAIVSAKLTIDDRIERNGKSVRNTNHTLRKQSILMIIIGGLFFYVSYLHDNLPIALLIFQGYLSFTVITSFMMEYSRLLFNSDENSILERCPVSNRTILCARIISMLYYLYLITFSLAVIPFFILFFKAGFQVALLFLFAVTVNTLFSLLLANLFYIGLIRFLPTQKFQQIITYVQSFMIIIVAFSYQFIGHLSNSEIDLLNQPGNWLFFTPPAYFMSFSLLPVLPGIYTFTLSGLGILLTLLLFILSITSFSQSYIQNASALDKAYIGKVDKHQDKRIRFLSRLFCPDALQQCGFILTWRMSRGNLKFKQSIIPMVIFALLFNVVSLYQNFQQPGDAQLGSLLYPLYLLPLMCLTILMASQYADSNHSLLSIYQSRPITRPGAILAGSLKAIYIKYFLPFLGVIYLIYFILFPREIWMDLLLAFSFSTLFIVVCYRFTSLIFPFSKEKSSFETGKIIAGTLLTMVVLSAMGFFHHFLSKTDWGVISAIPLCWVAIYFCTHWISSVSMSKIESHY